MQHHSYQFDIKFAISQQIKASETKTDRQQIAKVMKPWHFKHRKSIYTSEQDRKKKKRYNQLHWNKQENQKYATFLCQYIHVVNSTIKQKRKHHLNRMLSKYIGTRSPTQCRSHHQKMLRSFKDIQGIIANLMYIQNKFDDKSTPQNDLNSTQNIFIEERKVQIQQEKVQIQIDKDILKQVQTIRLKIDGDSNEDNYLWDVLQIKNQ